MNSRTYTVLCFFIAFFLVFTLFAAVFPKTYELYTDRQTFLENGRSLFKKWDLKPVVKQRKFYFFNVTNEDELVNPGAHMRVEEIGPFTYVRQKDSNESVNLLSYTDLKFLPGNSVGHEDVFIHLPFPKTNSEIQKPSPSNQGYPTLVKRTVRTLVMDLLNNRGSWARTHLRVVPSNASSSDFSEDELCSRTSVLSRFLNATFYNDPSTLNVYQALSCHSVTATTKRSQVESKSHPEYFDVPVTSIVLVWNNTVNTSGTHFQDLRHFVHASVAAAFDVESSSTIVTKFSLQYSMNVVFEHSGSNNDVTYPFLRTEISGQSAPSTDEFLYRYIIFPRIFKDQILPRIVFFAVCFLVASSSIIYILIYHSRSLEEDGEKVPLLKPSNKILLESLKT